MSTARIGTAMETGTAGAVRLGRTIHTIGTVTSTSTVGGISAVVAAVAVAEAIEKSPPDEWPALLAFAKDLVEEVLELAATGALDVNSAGGQLLLAIAFCGLLQTLSALMSRRPPS